MERLGSIIGRRRRTNLGKTHDIVDAGVKKIRQLDQLHKAGVVFLIFIGTDGLLRDLQFNAEPHLGHVQFLPQLSDPVLHEITSKKFYRLYLYFLEFMPIIKTGYTCNQKMRGDKEP